MAVFGIKERGGRVRSMLVNRVTAQNMREIVLKNIDMENAQVITDGHPAYRLIRNHLPRAVIDHELTYVGPENPWIHTPGIEGYWSLIKRGVYGVFHHVNEGYLDCYLSEFDFRFSRRTISDGERFLALMGQTQCRLGWYCRTPLAGNPFA